MIAIAALLLACQRDAPVEGPAEVVAAADAGADQVVEVGASLSLGGAGAAGVAFAWDLGDGAAADGAIATHAYAAPGHYVATVVATGSDGRTASDSAAITVIWPIATDLPRAAAALATSGNQVLAVLEDHDQLAAVDRATHGVDRVDVCDGPRSVAAGAATIAIACTGDSVALLDPDLTLRATVALPWGSRPYGVLIDPAGDVWVTLQGRGAVARISGDALVEWIDVGPDPRGLAWAGGELFVSRHRSADDGGTVWRIGGGLAEYRLAPGLGPDSDTNSRGVPTYLDRIAVRPDARTLVVGGLKANIGRGLVRDGLPLTHETTVRAVLRQVALDPDEGAVGAELAEPLFDDRDLVGAVAYHPRGDWLFVAFRGAGMIDVVDAYTMQRVGAFHAVGHGLDGVLVSEDGAELWALASISRELVVFDLADLFAPQREIDRIDLGAGGAEPLDPEVLLGKQVFYASADPRMTATAYVSCGSCHLDGDQDGRTWDFTDRGEGLRNTISLHGRRGTGHGPIHWSANFDEVQDFENDIRNAFGGQGFLSDADWAATSDTLGTPKAGRSAELDALAAYLASLDTFPRSPFRNDDGSLPADALAGEALFLSPETGCADCHPPPEYTDSAFLGPADPLLHDVGTVGPDSGGRLGGPLPGLDTPTLRGAHATPPYLHDGSAATIRDVLDRNVGDLHGRTSQLSATERDQLEAFLLTLE